MVDKPAKPAETLAAVHTVQRLFDVIRWQTDQLRLIGREPTVVVIGKTERDLILNHYRALSPTTYLPSRLVGLEVKIDGDVGVRVG